MPRAQSSKKATTARKKASTSKRTTSTRKKTTGKKTSKTITTNEEKEELVGDLKKTMKDVGRIPGIIFAPVIAYVSTKYDKIPEDRRKKLKSIVDSIKKWGKGSFQALKEWFTSAKNAVSKEEEKPTKKKRTTKKKTTTRKKTTTKKKAPAKKTTTRKKTTTTKKAPAKKTTTRKTAAKKAPAKKTTTRKKTTTKK